MRARVARAADGELIDVAGVAHLFKLTASDAGGRLGLERFEIGPGVIGARPHIHHEHDECFVVLDGTLTVDTADGAVRLGRGDLAFAPRGALHGFRNTDADYAIALCLYTPAGYERYFRDVHELIASGQEPSDAALARLRANYATTTPG